MKDIEQLFNIFKNEVTTAAQTFYAWKSIRNVTSSNREIYHAINENALSWNIIIHSLQSTFFITLGRLFDVNDEAFSIHAFLRACIDNIDQFGKEALRSRKLKSSKGNEPPWLNKYIEDAYVPVEKDFLILRGETSKKQKEYEEVYRPIKHEIIAHTDMQRIGNADKLFEKTNVGQVEDILQFLYQIEQIVCGLLDGKKYNIGYFTFKEESYVRKDIESLLKKLQTQHKSPEG